MAFADNTRRSTRADDRPRGNAARSSDGPCLSPTLSTMKRAGATAGLSSSAAGGRIGNMKFRSGHRKQVRHIHDPGHVHELTFSCYPRWPLLTIRQRPGVTTFRFWQEGPGYDRNLTEPKTVLHAIDYVHDNPVRRGLVRRAVDWKWSSARYHLLDPPRQFPGLPQVHSLPTAWLDATD